jgi:sugar lactone lactonase YvrE
MEGASFIDPATKFDLSTAVFVDAFSVSAQEVTPTGIAFNTDGTKMFIVGNSGDDVNEYTLSTGFDVSTASFVDSFSVSAQETLPQDIAFNTDGTKMFIVGAAGQDVNEYTLSTGFDVSTASFVDSFSVASQDTSPQGIAFNTDGTKMFIVGIAGQDVNEYTLSTGFDVSTASFVDSFSVSAQETSPRGIAFNTDGTKMFIVGSDGDAVNEYTLSTGFDVSTASFVDSFSVSAQETAPEGIAFNTDGSKMFIVGSTGDDVNEYNVGSINYLNQMNKTQLDAVTDPNQITLGNDLDLAIIFNMTSGTTVPSSDGVSINYDANVLNEGAILGTDYDFDAPEGDKARITALIAGNYKVRVV